MDVSCGENVMSNSSDNDFVKSITNEIFDILQVDDDELGVQIVNDLLESGRQALVKHKVDIISRVYNETMNGNDTRLIISLKKYFRQKWEIQYGSSNSWFISFLKQYENGDTRDVYERILIRTAEYGNKYMKECPLLSILLQLLFESIDNECLQQTGNVFDDLWMAITNDGLQSITKYSKYIVKKVLDEQLKKESVLFKALREYYRTNVFLSLTQSDVAKRQNLYDLALDDVVEHGWLSDMKSIEGDMAPRRYQKLLQNLRSFYTKQKPSENEDLNGPVVVPLSPKRVTTNNGQEEPSLKMNQSEINQPEATDSTQNVTSTKEPPVDTKAVIDALDNVTDANIQNTDTDKDDQGREDKESHVSHESKDDLDETESMLACYTDTIYISGLPTTIPRQQLFDKLNNVFTTCGDIKTYEQTNKPNIWLIPLKENKFKLSGKATVRFEKEESAMGAIEKYNRKPVPALNNAQISVSLYRRRPKVAGLSLKSTLTTESKPKAAEYPETEPSTIHTDTRRPKHDESASTTSSRNSGNERRIADTANTPILSKDRIFIIGLPTNMPEQLLFDTLFDEFSTVGLIKRDRITNDPNIYLFKRKDFKTELNGTATVTFENEESVIEAIEKYNDKQVSSLNDSRLCVQRSKATYNKIIQRPRPHSQPFLRHLPVPMTRPEGQPDGPVSIFWDIENVAIPAGTNAFGVLLKLRQRLMEDRKLSEGTFKTYYRNINNILPQHQTDLYLANVFVQHVASMKYGAVDEQIHSDLERFAEQHKTPATVVLISGDSDFTKSINRLRFRHTHYTIVIYNRQTKEHLLKTANEAIPWEEFAEKKYYNAPKQPYMAKTMTNPSNRVERSQKPSTPKAKDKSIKTSNPQHNLDKTCASTPSSKCPSLLELNVDNLAVNTDNDVLESISTIADQPNAVKNEPCAAKKHRKNQNKPNAQPPVLLMSLTNSLPNATIMDENLAVSSTKKTENSKEKKKKLAKPTNAYSCSICDRKFSADSARIQHEQDKHKIGTLVEISSTTLTNDAHGHSELSDQDDQANINLIAFTDDDDSNECDLSQPNLPTMTAETDLPVEISDNDSNTSESSSELNDSVQRQTNLSDNEKATEIAVDKRTEIGD